jgi:antitoxin component of MazEF toxin-antitoxin module
MAIKTVQKVIKIGSSIGVTLPAKDVKYAGIKIGDEVEIVVKKTKKPMESSEAEILKAAQDIIKRHL